MQYEIKTKHKHIEDDKSSELIWAKTCTEPLSFSVIPELRKGLRTTLKKFNVSLRIRQSFCQSLTEILTNLIEHPMQKATFTDIKIRKNGDHIHFCIRDNSAPFLAFDKKIQEYRQLADSHPTVLSRRGLGLIACLHQHVLYQSYIEMEDGYNHFCILERNDPAKAAGHILYDGEKSNRLPLHFSPRLFSINKPSPIRTRTDVKRK